MTLYFGVNETLEVIQLLTLNVQTDSVPQFPLSGSGTPRGDE